MTDEYDPDRWANEIEAENAKLRAMLRRLEWCGYYKYGYYECCPICDKHKIDGHMPNCELAALLKEDQ